MSDIWTIEVLLAGTGLVNLHAGELSPRHRVVIDSGLSIQESELAAALKTRGLSPDDIDIVINTHLHVDHCGNNSLFRAATIFASRAEWDWTHAFYAALFDTRATERVVPDFYPEVAQYNLKTRTVRNVARMARLFWHPERLGHPGRIRWLETSELPSGLEVLSTPGHTPHHLSIRVIAPQPVIVAGDAVLAEDADAKVKTMIPFSRARFLETRDELFSRGELIVPGHGPAFMPAPALPAATPRDGRKSRP